jgi:hypothetical protein
MVTIKVNGRPRTVEKRPHSYREIAAIAYPNPDFENFNYTITYLHGVHGAEGDLVEGETIQVKKGWSSMSAALISRDPHLKRLADEASRSRCATAT